MHTRTRKALTFKTTAHAAAVAAGAALLTLLVTGEAHSQDAPRRLHMFTTVGAFVPTGANSHVLRGAPALGSQMTFALNPTVSLTGSFTRASSEEESAAADGVDVYQYDIGAEAGKVVARFGTWQLRSFVGAGFGGRSYNYKDISAPAEHTIAGYGAAGAQMQMGRLAFRLEARDYVSGYKGLSAGQYGSSETRNDVMLKSGVSFGF
jgi:hypothetical protein